MGSFKDFEKRVRIAQMDRKKLSFVYSQAFYIDPYFNVKSYFNFMNNLDHIHAALSVLQNNRLPILVEKMRITDLQTNDNIFINSDDEIVNIKGSFTFEMFSSDVISLDQEMSVLFSEHIFHKLWLPIKSLITCGKLRKINKMINKQSIPVELQEIYGSW